MARKTICQLYEEVLEEFRRQSYTDTTVMRYRYVFKRFEKYAKNLGQEYYSAELAHDFIFEKCGIDIGSRPAPTPYAAYQIRSVWMLGYYESTGVIPGTIHQIKKPPPQFRGLYDFYIAECIERGLSASTIDSRARDIYKLLMFLEESKLDSLSCLSRDTLEHYLIGLSSKTPGSMSRVLSSLRCFFRSMFANGFIEENLSILVPRAGRYPCKPVQKLWSREEVGQLLGSIDRADSIGKRDFAIVLLIVRYGMRTSDILNLKLSCIDWDAMAISFFQKKTSVANTLPIFDDVGWALADWLANARPKQATVPHVFTRMVAPYCELEDIGDILKRRMVSANIQKRKGVNSGPHSLRHALASNMLSEEVPISIISAVLGQVSQPATMVYLHADVEGLRQCALCLEEVNHGS